MKIAQIRLPVFDKFKPCQTESDIATNLECPITAGLGDCDFEAGRNCPMLPQNGAVYTKIRWSEEAMRIDDAVLAEKAVRRYDKNG